MNGGANLRPAEREREEHRRVFWGLIKNQGMILILAFLSQVVGFSLGDGPMKTTEETKTVVAIAAAFSISLYFMANLAMVDSRVHKVCTAFGVASKGVLCTYLIKHIISPDYDYYVPETFIGVAILGGFALFHKYM